MKKTAFKTVTIVKGNYTVQLISPDVAIENSAQHGPNYGIIAIAAQLARHRQFMRFCGKLHKAVFGSSRARFNGVGIRFSSREDRSMVFSERMVPREIE